MFMPQDRPGTLRNLQSAKHLIYEADSVVISGHANPDGDSVGAMLSLGLGLESLGKRVHMLCTDDIPKNYRRLPGANRVVKAVLHPVDLAIAVDCGSKEMLGSAFAIFEKAETILEIDHHHSRSVFGDISLVDPEASSAGELVYYLLKELEVLLTREIAQNILTSIIVETNSFRLPGIRPRTFEVCAHLLGRGVDFCELSEAVYWVTSRPTALLSGICYSRCRFSDDGTMVWSSLTKRDMERVAGGDSDADPLAEKLRSIQGVHLAILFRQKNDNEWRVSLRSKGGLDVSRIAERFGGGGHINAAGCTIGRRRSERDQLLQYARDLQAAHRSKATVEFRSLPHDPQHLESLDGVQTALVFTEPPSSVPHFWERVGPDEMVYPKQLDRRAAS